MFGFSARKVTGARQKEWVGQTRAARSGFRKWLRHYMPKPTKN